MSFKVISGGQTGADRAALEAAKELGISTGGTAPKGWLTELGPDESLKLFGLRECNRKGYPARTIQNINNSCGTLVFRFHTGLGTDKTIGYAQTKRWCYGKRGKTDLEGYKPVLVIDSLSSENINRVVLFIRSQNISVLNVAGHRESTSGVPSFQNTVKAFLKKVFKQILNI